MAIFRKEKDTVHVKDAGKEPLDDDILPEGGRPVRQKRMGGNEPDTAGEHGEMAVETADALERQMKEKKD